MIVIKGDLAGIGVATQDTTALQVVVVRGGHEGLVEHACQDIIVREGFWKMLGKQ